MRIVTKSHKGLVREKNQDFLVVGESPFGRYAIVADGMGGHKGGELASQMAATSLSEKIEGSEIIQIKTWIEKVNQELFDYSNSNPEYNGMGTTLTLGLLTSGMLYLGHVGDSRAYLFRTEELCQLTTDHSFVQELINIGDITEEEASSHPMKNIVTQAVGTSDLVEIQTVNQPIESNDLILLCSDGLTNLVSNDEISEVLLTHQIEEAADKLLNLSLERGGNDNISLILISYEGRVD